MSLAGKIVSMMAPRVVGARTDFLVAPISAVVPAVAHVELIDYKTIVALEAGLIFFAVILESSEQNSETSSRLSCLSAAQLGVPCDLKVFVLVDDGSSCLVARATEDERCGVVHGVDPHVISTVCGMGVYEDENDPTVFTRSREIR